MKDAYGWDEGPRSFQLAGVQAQLEGRDITIQAPTGAGKTAIAAGPHLSPMSEGKLTIVVSPLMALQDEMVLSDSVYGNSSNKFLINKNPGWHICAKTHT